MPLYDGVVDSERRAGGGGGKGGGGVELRQGSVGRAGVGQALERLDGNGAAAAFYDTESWVERGKFGASHERLRNRSTRVV